MKRKAKPWPGWKPLTEEIEKMKEVEKEVLVEFNAGILEGKRARPMEKVVESFVRERILLLLLSFEEEECRCWIVASPNKRRFEELKLALKTNSVVLQTQLELRIVMIKRGRVCSRDIL